MDPQVSAEKEFQKLAELPCLEELVFFGNPIHRSMVEKEGEMAWPKFVLSVGTATRCTVNGSTASQQNMHALNPDSVSIAWCN